MSAERLAPPSEVRTSIPETPPQPHMAEPIVPKAYYELDEQQIRDKVTAALVEAERQKTDRIAAGDAKQTPVLIFMSETDNPESGQIADIDKARVMAEAERPYREEMIAKGLNNITSGLKNPDSLWSILREPIKVGKAFGKGMSRELLEIRARNASMLAGLNFDKIIEATKPYRPEVIVSKAIQEVVDFIDPEPEATPKASPEANEHAKHETDTVPKDAATPEKTPGIAEALNLSGQYAEQLQILSNSKLIERLSDGRFGYTHEHGDVPVPNWSQVEALIAKQEDMIKEKAGQGFNRLLLVPNRLSNERLAAALNESIAEHAESDNLHDASGVPIKAQEYGTNPHESDFIARPDQLKSLHDKEPSAEDSDDTTSSPVSGIPGWDIMLVKNMPEAPQNEHDVVVMNGRGEFMASKPRLPKKYENILATNPFCRNESGFTFGMWLTCALTEMERTGTAIDYHSSTLLLDSFKPNGGWLGNGKEMAYVGWDKRFAKGQASPMQVKWGTVPPGVYVHAGIRTAVRLG